MQAVINPGDEVIVIEPFYDWYLDFVLSYFVTPQFMNFSYPPCIEMAGGIPKYVSLRPPVRGISTSAHEWALDLSELEQAVSKKTKVRGLQRNPLPRSAPHHY